MEQAFENMMDVVENVDATEAVETASEAATVVVEKTTEVVTSIDWASAGKIGLVTGGVMLGGKLAYDHVISPAIELVKEKVDDLKEKRLQKKVDREMEKEQKKAEREQRLAEMRAKAEAKKADKK